MMGAIDQVTAGLAVVVPQSKEQVTRAPKLKKEEGIVDWTKPATQIHNFVRAMNPWPLASTSWQDSAKKKTPLRLIIHRTRPALGPEGQPGVIVAASPKELVVATGSGALELLIVQMVGKKPLAIEEFQRGFRGSQGDLLG